MTFDEYLDKTRSSRGKDDVEHLGVFDAAVFVRDTLEIAQRIEFDLKHYNKDFSDSKKEVTPTTIAIYDRICARRLELIHDWEKKTP